MRSDYSPLETMQNLLRHAWLVVIFMLAGGLAGWGVVRARPPVYEARIVYAFSVDFAQTGILSDIEYDQAMDAAGDLLWSDAVVQTAARELSAAGLALDAAALRAMATQERTANDWIIRVRAASPDQAAQVANAWGQAAADSMQTAYSHALRAETILRYLDSVESCLERTVSSEPVEAFCNPDNLTAVLQRFEESKARLQAEATASLGLMPGLRYQWAQQATLPAQRVSAGQGVGVLGGALLGWLAALVTVQAGWLPRIARKLHRG